MRCLVLKKKNIISKTQNTNSIRVLYKKVGQTPKVKIINNIYKLKKAIIQKKLDIVPYEKLFIICHSNKSKLPMRPNIFLPLRRIIGDLVVVNIDKKSREFQSISQEDIIWFSKDLTSKSAKIIKINSQQKKSNFPFIYERGVRSNQYNDSPPFYKSLISMLINIQLALATVLKNNGDDNNDKKGTTKKNTGT